MQAAKGVVWVVLGCAVVAANAAWGQDRWNIAYPRSTPEGLVGNGHSVVRVRPDGIDFHAGGDAGAHFRLALGDSLFELSAPDARATFFPGGVRYAVTVRGVQVEILHGALADVPWFACVRVRGARGPVAIEVAAHGAPALAPSGRVAIPCTKGSGEVVLAAGAAPPAGDMASFQQRLEAPYRTGLVLETPSASIDRAVPFSRALLDVGFDGRMHVCDIFRWRDVWSRDLGSGLAPGAMASGRFDAAATTIGYDLKRHATADPRGLKVTQDPSQGGTAEGVAWLTRAAWRQYLLTGDRAWLHEAERSLKPWVEAWIDRDPDERGLLVDVSEWMDHSRFFLFPDGARVLYSNVLFAELLRRFATIEDELGDHDAARRYEGISARFVQGINAGLWDEARGMYDNLSLWGLRDERCSAAENALAVLCGVAPEARARRALATVQKSNWRKAGSTTIYPPMTHVPEYIDHNYKMWPWWNAVEARARFRVGDLDGGAWLLDRCAATLEDEHYPGMMEELTSPDGVTEGGFAFLTAAGSYLDAIVGGLLGVEIVAPGCARVRVDPKTPAAWKNWRAEVPLPQGSLALTLKKGRLRIRVTDPRVVEIEAPAGAIVEGARRVELSPRPYPELANDAAPGLPELPAPRARGAAILAAEGCPVPAINVPPGRRVEASELSALDPADVGALVVLGNALPRHSADGTDVPAALTGYLDRGGALVFYGATMQERGTMGEHGGVVEWYEQRPVVRNVAAPQWLFRRSPDAQRVAQTDERGMRERWQDLRTGADADWKPITVPATWEKATGVDFDGWGWYRASFTLPADARGKAIVVHLGRIDDDDWAFVNGKPIGAQRDWQSIRHYRVRPGDPAYDALVFGGENWLAVQVLDTGGGGGLYADTATVGVETSELAWAPIDPRSGEVAPQPARHGVVSWGPGGRFFNSWETSRGAFGFAIEGSGVEFAGPLAGLAPLETNVGEAFTDFAVSRPWRFEPLAYTTTQRKLLVPDHGERYPCAARLVDTSTGGEILLIPASLVRTAAAAAVLDRLRIGLLPGRRKP
jgi:hypothetical protein